MRGVVSAPARRGPRNYCQLPIRSPAPLDASTESVNAKQYSRKTYWRPLFHKITALGCEFRRSRDRYLVIPRYVFIIYLGCEMENLPAQRSDLCVFPQLLTDDGPLHFLFRPFIDNVPHQQIL